MKMKELISRVNTISLAVFSRVHLFCDVLHLLFGFQVVRTSEWRRPLNHNDRTKLFFAWL